MTGRSDIADRLESTKFVRRVLGLGELESDIFPVSLSAFLSQSKETNLLPELERFARALANRCDVLLLETGGSPSDGSLVSLDVPTVVKTLGAQTLIISRFTGEGIIDAILATRQVIDHGVVGAVVTSVPVSQRETMQQVLRPALERRGVRVLGIFPSDSLLGAVTVGELAKELGGTFIVGHDLQDELVERLMIGAMNPEHAVSYFQRQANKAVITGGDRPDIQLAALETSTRCLILTGQFPPVSEVVERATIQHVAVISVPLDSLTAVERAQAVFEYSRYQQDRKVARFGELFNVHFDYAALLRVLALRT